MNQIFQKFTFIVWTIAVVAAGFLPVSAQKKLSTEKKRTVNIYLLEYPKNNFSVEPNIIRIKRKVNAETPLTDAIKKLLTAMIEKKPVSDSNNYLYKLKFLSARIKNGTARLDFSYDQELEFDWLSESHPLFPEIIERTALQFSNVKRVLMCINGDRKFAADDGLYSIDCDEEWEKK